MKTAQRRVKMTLLSLALIPIVLLPSQAVARPDALVGVRTTIEVVAEGLDTPRGVHYDRILHRVLVAEAGDVDENTGPCAAGNGGVIYCVGRSGAIFQYSAVGLPSRRIVTGLPSLRTEDNSAVLGVHDLDLFLGRINVVFGLSGRQSFRDALGPQGVGLGATGYIDGNGNLVPTGDLAAFEEVNNPDGRRIDTDGFGLFADLLGTVVADAAGNDILRVRHDGTVELLAFLPPRDFMGDPDYESVPTSVVRGPDGALYVGELSGFPYHKGSARVLRVVPGSPATISVFAEGFTNIADLVFDERGRLHVLEMAKEGLFLPEDTVTGRLVRVERDGTQTDLATTGLENPGGVAYAGDGVFYVTNRTTGTGDNGQLLRLRVRG